MAIVLNDLDELLGETPSTSKRKTRTTGRRHRRRSLGDLHAALSKALPDLCDSNGVCDLRALAEKLDLSYVAVWKWMRPGAKNRLPARHADKIAELSKKQKTGDAKFVPATKIDLLPYIF
jgi:hypothetical protein